MTKPIIVSLEFTYDPDAGEARLIVSESTEHKSRNEVVIVSGEWVFGGGKEVNGRDSFTGIDGVGYVIESHICTGYADDLGCELGARLYDLIKSRAEDVL